MLVLNIIDSKILKKELRQLFVNHHYEYDFSDSEDDFCELIELTKANIIIIQSDYENVKGQYILNHILKFCNVSTIEKIIVLFDDPNYSKFNLNIEPKFKIEYHSIEMLNDTLLNKIENSEVSVEVSISEEPHSTEPKKILYVSDDRFMQIIVSDMIHNNTNYEITTANNGTQGFNKYMENHPNLIITDLVMPGINGLELCKKIKIENHDNNANVIIFSSTSDEETIKEAYSLKAKAYIVKPIEQDKFIRKINRILS